MKKKKKNREKNLKKNCGIFLIMLQNLESSRVLNALYLNIQEQPDPHIAMALKVNKIRIIILAFQEYYGYKCFSDIFFQKQLKTKCALVYELLECSYRKIFY